MRSVLFVDDSREDREVLRDLTQDWSDFRVVIEERGEDGVARLGQEPFDCVVLDYLLQGEDGLEIIGRVRDINPSVPVILLTGHGNETVEAETLRAGVRRYLPKRGLTSDLLRSTVERAILTAQTVAAEALEDDAADEGEAQA